MRRSSKSLWTLALAACVVSIALPAVAQDATGSLTGRAMADGEAMPGVTVTVLSDAMQGDSRTAVSNSSGDYIFHFLPPGTYHVTFGIGGFATLETEVKLSAGQTRRLDAEMQAATMREEIEVTGRYETISSQTEAQTTMDFSVMEKLAVSRTIENAVILSPGTQANGPGGNLMISGAMSFENLYLINGVVVNENLRGQPHDLYIEDAVQETTTYTSGISAEYGRFAGGVINTITKSGGNQFSGSLRVNFENESWSEMTPGEISQADTINQIYEATLGGYIMRDHLWFFLAGRSREEDAQEQTVGTNISYPALTTEDRYEVKLTVSPHINHRVMLSYFDRETVEDNRDPFYSAADLESIGGVAMPQTGISATYNGVLTKNLFVELIYSKKETDNRGSGPYDTSLAGGSWFEDVNNPWNYNAPHFFGNPDWSDKRDNENAMIKGSYFASTSSFGSHDIVFGYDTFTDIRKSNNHQSGSDHSAYVWGTLFEGDEVYPVVHTGGDFFAPWLVWWPIMNTSQGTDFATNSFFANDTWRLNNKWSFNVGVRYDINDGVDSEGKAVIDDSKLSPRLGASYDVKGDGEWIINANYSNYTAAIANSVANESSSAGTPAIIVWFYDGPEINTDPTQSLVDKETAMGMIWDWFFNVHGGHENIGDNFWFADIPGATAQINQSLASPSTEEYSIGVTKRLGRRGLIRADYVHREGADFYSSRIDMTTGQVEIPGGAVDLELIGNNDNQLERTYDGLHVAGQYRLGDRWQIGGTYTLSELTGNINGENYNSGPLQGAIESYPEYHENSWAHPVGSLLSDQRHKLKAWAIWDAVSSRRHNLSASVLASYNSGTHYSAYQGIDTSPYVTNPGYLQPDGNKNYYFTDRGAFTTDDMTRIDLALNYSFFVSVFGGQLELYIQPEVINVFNSQSVIEVNGADIIVAGNDPTGQLQTFDPFTETPQQGVHWDYGENFGQPVDEDSYQLPREFRFSVGVRF